MVCCLYCKILVAPQRLRSCTHLRWRREECWRSYIKNRDSPSEQRINPLKVKCSLLSFVHTHNSHHSVYFDSSFWIPEVPHQRRFISFFIAIKTQLHKSELYTNVCDFHSLRCHWDHLHSALILNNKVE